MFQSTKNSQYRLDGTGATNCTSPPTEDADGYPLKLRNNGCFYVYYVVPGVPYPAGHYVFTYDGTGTILIAGDAKNVTNTLPNRLEFDVSAPTAGTAPLGIWLTITATSEADHLRNFHLFLGSDEATYLTQPFRQEFLDLLAPFRIIRFMNWSGVSQHAMIAHFSGISQPDSNTIILPVSASPVDNAYQNDVAVVHSGDQWPRIAIDRYDGASRTLHLNSPVPVGTATGVLIEDFPNRTWDQRTPLSNQRQQGPSGVAYEYMVGLAKLTNKDIWITIPTAANDDFVTQLATLLRDSLSDATNLKIYLEYSNETWNFEFPGYDFSEAAQKKFGVDATGTVVPADAWHAFRAVRIFQLFNQVFNEPDLSAVRKAANTNSRLVRVLTSQTAWPARFQAMLGWTNRDPSNKLPPNNGHLALEYADAIAVTNYWGFPADYDPSQLQTQAPDKLLTQMIAAQMQSIDQLVAPADPNGSNYLYNYAQFAAQFTKALGLKLIVYEGGEGFIPASASASAQPAIVNALEYMNHVPQMADVYKHSLTQWQWLSQQFPGTIGNWAQYDDVGPCSKYGCFGLLDSLFLNGKVQDRSTAPRYQGIINFLNGSPAMPSF